MKRILQLDPAKAPATWDEIKAIRDSLEQAPLEACGYVFDVDPISLKRIEMAIEQFDELPTLDAQGRLTWKLADNSLVPVTKTELQTVYQALRRGLALRAAALHVVAESLRAMLPAVTKGQVEDPATWQL